MLRAGGKAGGKGRKGGRNLKGRRGLVCHLVERRGREGGWGRGRGGGGGRGRRWLKDRFIVQSLKEEGEEQNQVFGLATEEAGRGEGMDGRKGGQGNEGGT